jgi:hypothetical protein
MQNRVFGRLIRRRRPMVSGIPVRIWANEKVLHCLCDHRVSGPKGNFCDSLIESDQNVDRKRKGNTT